MARIAGIDIPPQKRTVIALMYIHGIGRTTSEKSPFLTHSSSLQSRIGLQRPGARHEIGCAVD